MSSQESHYSKPVGRDKEIAPDVWLHEMGTREEWVEIFLAEGEREKWSDQRRTQLLSFYVDFRRQWQWDETNSDRVVGKELPMRPVLSEVEYLVGAARSANAVIVMQLVNERLQGMSRRERSKIISRSCRLALRGRFQLTNEPFED